MASNITHLTMEEGKVRWCTKALTQYDYGQRLVIDGIELPSNYEVFFSNSERSNATTSIGDSTGVDIPDWVLESGECIFIWVFLHTGSDDGETVATGVIKVNPRSKSVNEPPTPQQLDVISQLMAALNVSVEEAQALAADIPVRIQTALQEAKDSGEFNGPKGDTGAVFTPSVNDGVMSWTNNGGLPNPEPTNFTQELGLDRYATKQEVSGKIDSGLIGSPNGVAALDASGRIPSEQLPSYVDDVLEYPSFQDFPSQGETGKIYIDLSNNYQYRWSGSQYINITGGDLDSRKADKRDTVLETTLSRGRQANTVAGAGSIAFGSGNTASGQYSTALGVTTAATGNSAVAEGGTTIAEGDQSHAEGYSTYAKGRCSHTEGEATQALDSSAHAEGNHTHATGARSHAEGSYTQASGLGSHAEGSNTVASNDSAHAEGSYTEATNTASHVEGYGGESEGVASHAEGGYTSALEDYSHAEGCQSQAYEYASHAEGSGTQARGEASHSEGISTYAYGLASHAEGEQTYANGARSHSEGYQTRATGAYSHSEGMGGTFTNQTVEYTSGAHGDCSHSEGYETYANGTGAHAEGHTTVASVQYAHAEGTNTLASGYGGSHAEGNGTLASQDSSHAEGYKTQASEDAAHAEGRQTVASGLGSHAEGSSAQATGSYSHAEGGGTQATANGAHAEGSGSQATADNAHAEGSGTRATGSVSHAEGSGTSASGFGAHAEGGGTTASGSMSHAEGTGTTASNSTSHAEGAGTQATGANSHAEGSGSRAIGLSSHAEGSGGAASGYSSHVEGGGSTASGEFAHAENQATTASGKGSHAEGYATIARGAYSHVGGIHNIEDSYDNWTEWTPGEHCVPGDKRKRTQTVNEETIVEGFVCKTENMDAEWDKTHWFDLYGQMNYAVIIGNGFRNPEDQYEYVKSNAYTLDWDGNGRFAGDVYVGCNPDGTGGVKLGASAVDDVRIEGTSILQNGIANIPLASTSPGLVKINNNYGIGLYAGSILHLNMAEVSLIKKGVNTEKPIVPLTQDRSVFYGLAKLAGADMKDSNNAVGTYTDEAKQAILKMLGLDGILGDFESTAVASKAYAIGETFVYNGKRYRATAAIAISDVIAPGTNCVLDPIDGHYVRDTDYATSAKAGVVKIGDGLSYSGTGILRISAAWDSTLKAGSSLYYPIVPAIQHKSVFYALSKLAGVDLASSSTPIGVYTTEARAAILAMLGANGSGLQILNGRLGTISANTALIKSASDNYASIVPSHIQDAVFFGLAKAANADMASLPDVTVGQYPQAQKTAIQNMLGVPVASDEDAMEIITQYPKTWEVSA